MVFILFLLFLCNLTIIPSDVASNQVPNEFLHMRCSKSCSINHSIKSWFEIVCDSFRNDPKSIAEQFSQLASKDNDFVPFLNKVTTACEHHKTRFDSEYYDYWFSNKPIFTTPQSLHTKGISGANCIEKTLHTKENFTIKTLFNLFVYLGVQIPISLQKQYEMMYSDRINEPIFYTNDFDILYRYYQTNLFEYIGKTRALLPLHFMINENFMRLITNDMSKLRQCLYFAFEQCNENFNSTRLMQFQELLKTCDITDIINRTNGMIFKDLPSLETISIPFNSINEEVHKICTFLKIFSPKTMHINTLFRCRRQQYNQFISGSASNPYKNKLILEQLDDSEIQSLFEALDYTKELLDNEENSESTKFYIRNLLHRFIESPTITNDQKTALVFEKLLLLLENNNLSELCNNDHCCDNWIKNSSDENGNNLLHRVLQKNKRGESIENVIKRFTELVQGKNNKNQYPKDIYDEQLSQAGEKNNLISLTEATDKIAPDFQPLEQNIVDILNSVT